MAASAPRGCDRSSTIFSPSIPLPWSPFGTASTGSRTSTTTARRASTSPIWASQPEFCGTSHRRSRIPADQHDAASTLWATPATGIITTRPRIISRPAWTNSSAATASRPVSTTASWLPPAPASTAPPVATPSTPTPACAQQHRRRSGGPVARAALSTARPTLPPTLTDYIPYYGWFVQDNFRLTSKLTINMGIRWEHEGGVDGSEQRTDRRASIRLSRTRSPRRCPV